MGLVPDISAILALAFEDEDAVYAELVLTAIGADEGVVPTLFWFEIRNALLMAERRKRITIDQTAEFLASLAVLPITIDEEPDEQTVLRLARTHTLTVYDAAYLELALRRSLPIATLDADLQQAALAANVAVFSGPVQT